MRPQPGLISLLLISMLFGLPGSLELELEMVETETERERERGREEDAVAISKSLSILKSDTINDNTFHRSQSKRAATLAKSQPLISATTQITKPNDEQIARTTTTTATAIHRNVSSALSAVAAPLESHSNINNISNNGVQRRWTTVSTMPASAPGVTAALQANLIMSNRNVEQQKLDEHEYKITQSNNNALFVASSSSSSNMFSNNSTATTFAAPATVAEATTTATPITTTSTAATTTTRRPAPRTTLKPPPTIDDYQTIISQAGTHAYLPCNVKQLVKKPISWLRMRDGHILTVDQTTFIADQRFQSVFSPNPERWSLQIKYVQLKDEGTYECQVSTEPKASAIVHLRIVEPKTELIGESTRHVKAGSQVKLRCIISQALEPPLFINWFYNQKQIYLHNRRGWRTEIERIDLPTEAPTTSTAATTSTSTTATTTSTTTATSITSTTPAATPAEALNDIAAITRSYILDAIAVGDGIAMAGYGYVLPTSGTPIYSAATMSTAANAGAAVATSGIATAQVAAASAAIAADTSAILTLPPTGTTAATTLPVASTVTTKATTASAATSTTTTTTTTTMLPSSSFIKQITTASLIIPAVVKLDSGNYTCSPSNSAPRTIVLHVLNGEYSASAIKSASVSWNTLIGCPGYLRWPNVSTILTLLWIIKFVLAWNVTICCNRGRNKVNNRPSLEEAAATQTTITRTTTRITGRTTACDNVSRRLSTQTQTKSKSHGQSQSQSQTTTRRQRRFGLDCGCGGCCCGGDCGHVSSSISGTKVAEDKT
ncbi:mucin-5AC isoform X2 [Drosophila nasuta]|uniref:mucin-5AC isoform X2 n=1 Tax=Drosophila nasuta TaxID=42062 RepID=UPI00295F3D27|nr:mucin-5AC isoform X2 [Drosophila nasuta]